MYSVLAFLPTDVGSSTEYTFTVPVLPTLLGMGIISVVLIGVSVVNQARQNAQQRSAGRFANEREKERLRIEKIKASQASQEEGERETEEPKSAEEEEAELAKLFPAPWRYAYDRVYELDTYRAGKLWFYEWLRNVSQTTLLPALTIEAIERLTEELVDTEDKAQNDNHETILKTLRAHLDEYDEEEDDAKLRNALPGLWYDFLRELRNYPEPRSLFLKKIGSCEGADAPRHPACKVPLTTEAAKVFAETLGANKTQVGFFASDLTQFIKMRAEKKELHTNYHPDCIRGDAVCEGGHGCPSPTCKGCAYYFPPDPPF